MHLFEIISSNYLEVTTEMRILNRFQNKCKIVIFLFTTFSFSLSPLEHYVLYKDVLSFLFQTFEFSVLCFGFCVLCPQKFETQNSKHPYTKHNVQMGTS